jgi:hypothetical protein
MKICFLFPLPLLRGRENDDRNFRGATAKFLNRPDLLDAGQFDIDDASAGEAMGKKRFGFVETGAVDDAVLLRIQTRPECLIEFRVLSQH